MLSTGGQYELLETQASQLSNKYPEIVPYWRLLGQARLGLGKPAVDVLERAAELAPSDASILALLALAYQNAGDIDAARRCFERSLILSPSNPVTCFNFGVLLLGQGEAEAALKMFDHAAMLQPNWPAPRFNCGVAAEMTGDIVLAEDCYRDALCIAPNYPLAHFNLALLQRARGSDFEAEYSFRRAVAADLAYVDAVVGLADLVQKRGDGAEAETIFRNALQILPEHPTLLIGLAALCLKRGGSLDALPALRSAVRLAPDSVEAWQLLGTCEAGLGHSREALAAYASALRLGGARSEIVLPYAKLLHTAGQLGLAADCLSRVPRGDAGWGDAMAALVTVLVDAGRVPDAIEVVQSGVMAEPDEARWRVLECWMMQLQGNLDAAIAAAQRALSLDHESTDARSVLLFLYNYKGWPSLPERVAEARRYGEIVTKRARPYRRWECGSTNDRLRVGLVSGDFREHAVGHFLEAVVASFSRNSRGIELIAYPTYEQDDSLSRRLRSCFRHWHSLAGVADEAAAARIHGDGVHILIDLSGHSMHNRLPLFAWRPAPVQASWLAYFATTGVSEIDYFIADRVGVPVPECGEFTERVRYLPETRLCFSVPENAPDVVDAPGIASGQTTFGSFQNLQKITDQVLVTWAIVLAGVPDSRLLIQSPQLGGMAAMSAMQERIRMAGIPLGRVILREPVGRISYLSAYSDVDIVLDTFPFPGGTTTCEALWMGVPTLTLAGETLLARQGASIMTAAGHPEWIARDLTEYQRLAVYYGKNLDEINRLRHELRGALRHSPLFDADSFSTGLAKLLWSLWQESSGDARSRGFA